MIPQQSTSMYQTIRRRHENFYRQDGSCVFAVGDYLYNLHASIFTDLSDIFEHVYTVPQSDSPEGKSDDNPFVLEGIDSGDFNYFLEYMYHKRDDDDTEPLQYLLSVLKLCTLWNIGIGRRFAIRRLSARDDFDASLKLHLAQTYDVDEWVDPAFRQLMSKNYSTFTDQEAELMGITNFRILMRTMLHIDFMRLCVAYSSLEIIHSPGCMDNEQCQKAWDSEWWRGFCRHLLHPDKLFNPNAAVIMLENVKIKNMCSDCLDATVAAITSSNVLDYRNSLISEGIEEILGAMHARREQKIVKAATDDLTETDEIKGDLEVAE